MSQCLLWTLPLPRQRDFDHASYIALLLHILVYINQTCLHADLEFKYTIVRVLN